MDTTRDYINKCGKAKEIQALQPYQDSSPSGTWLGGSILLCTHPREWAGSYFFVTDTYAVEACLECGSLPDHVKSSTSIWLPLQGQLQRMVCEGWGLQTTCTRIEEFSKSQAGSAISIMGTMEQLWLAFVMKRRYSRIWLNEDWGAA